MSLRLAFARIDCTPMTHCVPKGWNSWNFWAFRSCIFFGAAWCVIRTLWINYQIRKQNHNPATAVVILNEERPLLSRWTRLRGHLTYKGHFWVCHVNTLDQLSNLKYETSIHGWQSWFWKKARWSGAAMTFSRTAQCRLVNSTVVETQRSLRLCISVHHYFVI